jgi:hypothetical protein
VSNPQLFAWASDCAGRYWSEEKKRTSRETRINLESLKQKRGSSR